MGVLKSELTLGKLLSLSVPVFSVVKLIIVSTSEIVKIKLDNYKALFITMTGIVSTQ